MTVNWNAYMYTLCTQKIKGLDKPPTAEKIDHPFDFKGLDACLLETK